MSGKKVKAPNGSTVELKGKEEVDFFLHKMEEYREFQSEHPNDMDILTQMIYLQTLNFRYMSMLTKFDDTEIDEIKEINRIVKDNVNAINSCADSLQISKKYRDSKRGSIADYINELEEKALIYKEELIDKTADKAISNMMKIKTILRLRKVCDQEERFKLKIPSDEDIFLLIENLIKEFEELDNAFIEEQQHWWLSE